MVNVRITQKESDSYKREVLESITLITLDAAATAMSMHPDTLKRRVDDGRLVPYNDNGGHKGIRFLASELQAYVKSMRRDL